MKTAKIALIAALAVALAGCESGKEKETIGTVLGAVGGAVIGAQFGRGTGQLVGVAAGTLIGGLLGREIGKSLDKADVAAAERAQQQAQTAPVGTKIAWSNPESGNAGAVTPVREGRDEKSGAYCREFQQEITVAGKTEQAYGTACRQSDGSWKVVNGN